MRTKPCLTAADANWLIKHVPEGTPVTITG